MSDLTCLGYVLVLAFWWLSLRRDGGLGIGIRFTYGMNLFMFFLLGPLLGEIFRGNADRSYIRAPLEPAVQLALIAMTIYVASAYWIFPLLVGRRTLIPLNFARDMANSSRLRSQYRVGWLLIWIGLLCL